MVESYVLLLASVVLPLFFDWSLCLIGNSSRAILPPGRLFHNSNKLYSTSEFDVGHAQR